MKINLSRGLFTEVSPEWYEKLRKYKWFARYSKSNNAFYACRNVGKFPHRGQEHMHRIIMSTPDGLDVDHINGDNRVENLRNCTRSDNAINSKIREDNTSGYRGVWKTKSGTWCARVMKNGCTVFQRNYKIKIDAARAYNIEAIKAFGEFAVLNFLEDETDE